MRSSALSILWICGPPGVGKSTAAWRVFSSERTDRTALLDVDQLGLRLPAPADDPGNHRVKLAVLDAVVDAFERAGVRRLIVSGVLLPELAAHVAHLAPGRLRICLLTCGFDELAARYLGRDPNAEDLPRLREGYEALQAIEADDTIDTTGVDPDAVAALVADVDRAWRPAESARPARVETDVPLDPLPGVWLHGPRAAGASTAGFTAMLRLVESRPAAYLDLTQYGFVRPVPPPDEHAAIRRAAVAAATTAFHHEGADALVVVGDPASVGGVDAMRAALPWVALPLGWLVASDDALAERMRIRVAGLAHHLAGDDLIGAAPEVVERELARAVADAAAPAPDADFTVDSTGQTAAETADAVLAASGMAPR